MLQVEKVTVMKMIVKEFFLDFQEKPLTTRQILVMIYLCLPLSSTDDHQVTQVSRVMKNQVILVVMEKSRYT